MRQVLRLRDRFLGAVVGLAVGDALGSPFEFLGRHQIEMKYGRVNDMVGGGWQKLRPGEWADDTEQFLQAIESWLMVKGFDGLDLTGRIIDWAGASPERVSVEIRELVRELEKDPEHWESMARSAWYQSAGVFSTNSCLARSLAAGLFHPRDLKRAAQEAVRLCHITHFDPRCAEAAVALSFLIVQTLAGRVGKDLIPQCLQFLETFRKEDFYKTVVLNYDERILSSQINATPLTTWKEDKDAVAGALKGLGDLTYDDLCTSTYVVHTFQTAAWIFLNAESYDEGVSMAASLGGGADTQAAVAGALLGARFGYNAISPHWLKDLRERGRLVSMGELLLVTATG